MLVGLPTYGPLTARNGLKRLSGYQDLHFCLSSDTITEEPISPECRLAICLYRLARGDYYFTIAEMAGIGERTVGYIVNEETSAIVECLWEDSVTKHMPKSEDEFKIKILDMEEAWQSLAVGQPSMGVIYQLSAPLVDWSHVKNTITLIFFFFRYGMI